MRPRPPTRRSLMRGAPWPLILDRSSGCCLLAFCLLAALAAPGCGHKEKTNYTSVSKPPTVRIIQPEVRKIVRVVGQPSFIESYERTSIYPKLTGYIEKWNVDIGDKVKKGDVLATLFVPELVEDFGTKKATVKLDEERVELARKMVEVADADVKAAEASLVEAKAILAKYQAEVDRWDTEVKRLTHEVKSGRGRPPDPPRVDQPVEVEHRLAGRGEGDHHEGGGGTALQTGHAREGQGRRLGRPGRPGRGRRARRSGSRHGWATSRSPRPIDGVIVARNANTVDFVLPTTGDPTAMARAPYLSPGGTPRRSTWSTAPTSSGSSSTSPSRTPTTSTSGRRRPCSAQAYRDEPIPGTVTRTSWALNVKSRTLRAEIDLPNPGSQLLPGMYAYAKVIIERPGVRALPLSALTHSGDKTFCWTYQDGHAERTEIQTGVSDGEWIEVTNLQRPPASNGDDPWTPINGSEQVILGDLSILAEGAPRRGRDVAGRCESRECRHSSPVSSVGSTERATWSARPDAPNNGPPACHGRIA